MDNILFLAGLAAAVCSAAAAAIILLIHRQKMKKLMKLLDSEYGERSTSTKGKG